MLLWAYSILSMVMGGILLGLSIYPSVLLLAPLAQSGPLGLSFALGLGYFLSSVCLLGWCALAHHLLFLGLKPGRTPLLSLTSFRWATASSLYMLIKYTCGDFLMATPFFTLYLRVVGARIGDQVMINSKFLHDHGLLDIGAGTLIGGDAVLSAHVAEKGDLLLSPIKVGKKCLIGQKSVLMPGVEVGDGAVVAAGAIVLKDTKIPAGEVWGGIPARCIRVAKTVEPVLS
jgi:non-ribosomal peptide synthetase-like protein